MAKSKVFLRSVKNGNLHDVLNEVLDKMEWKSIIYPDASVVIKTNHGDPIIQGIDCSNTSLDLVKAACEIIKGQTNNITIVESNGPRHKAEEVWEITGLDDVCRQMDIKLVNLSNEQTRPIAGHFVFGEQINSLSPLILDADVFIDMPKIKTHALTRFTGSIKNLWGCVPCYDRVLLHRYLNDLLSDLVGLLKPRIGIMDGIVCMEGRGPTNGKARNLDVILASTDIVALDGVSARLVGIDPYGVEHLVLAEQKNFGNIDSEEIVIDGDFDELRVEFEPAILDWPNRVTNYMTRYRWFVKHILFNDVLFHMAKKVVNALRKIGVAGRAQKIPRQE